jgi:hypothetical protein
MQKENVPWWSPLIKHMRNKAKSNMNQRADDQQESSKGGKI